MGGGAGAEQHTARAQPPQMPQQRAADAVPLIAGQNVCVTYQINIAHRLNAHDADQGTIILAAPERHAGGDLAVQLALRHIGIVPSIGRDHAAIGFGRSIDYREDHRPIILATGSDRAHRASPGYARQRPVSAASMIGVPTASGEVITDSGWNCTAAIRKVLRSIAMIT